MEIKKFLKIGDKVVFKPQVEGLEYDLQGGEVYNIEVEKYSDQITLVQRPSLSMPEKKYFTDEDNNFMDRVLACYKNRTESTLGVMLSGLKGSGKSVMAKEIAQRSNLPIIVIDKYARPWVLKKLLANLADIEVCFLFDEIDKLSEDYDDDFLLQLLDGNSTMGKKLFLFTANNPDDINEYLVDRCSRIRYWREFEEMQVSLIQIILKDKLNDDTKIKEVTDFIVENMKVISFDNVNAFVNEINEYPDENLETLFSYMNLSRR